MANEEIVLIARLKVKADRVEELKSAALAIVGESRNEAGNINYDIHQSIEDETVFFWHETWVNKAAIDEHFGTPFFGEFFKVVGDVAAEPPQINLTRMITEKAQG
jgi:quinol monooxygenase YgiN